MKRRWGPAAPKPSKPRAAGTPHHSPRSRLSAHLPPTLKVNIAFKYLNVSFGKALQTWPLPTPKWYQLAEGCQVHPPLLYLGFSKHSQGPELESSCCPPRTDVMLPHLSSTRSEIWSCKSKFLLFSNIICFCSSVARANYYAEEIRRLKFVAQTVSSLGCESRTSIRSLTCRKKELWREPVTAEKNRKVPREDLMSNNTRKKGLRAIKGKSFNIYFLLLFYISTLLHH